MNQYVALASALLNTLCAISFTLLAVLGVRQYAARREGWGGPAYVWTAVACAAHFVLVALAGILHPVIGYQPDLLRAADTAVLFLLAPMLFQVFYHEEQFSLVLRTFWTAFQTAFYATALGGAVCCAFFPIRGSGAFLLTASRMWIAVAGIMAVLVMATSRCAARRPP